MANTYLQRTFESGGNRKTWTLSMWVKFSASGSNEYFLGTRASSDNRGYISKHTSDVLYRYDKVSGSGVIDCSGTRKLRDCNGWYNLVFRQDTTQGSASDRYRIYINGVQETISYDSGATTPDQNEDLGFNVDEIHALGTEYAGSSSYFNGSMSHVHFCDGQSYAPTVFGETDSNGVWKIKTSPSVTYGTNGFFILKDGNSVTDQSGEGNNFTVAAGTLTNDKDCPSNVFATMNPLDNYYASSDFSEGNNTVNMNDSGNETYNTSTLGVTKGKYYAEVKLIASSAKPMTGVVANHAVAIGTVLGNAGHGYAFMGEDGKYKTNSTNTTYGNTYTTNDIISIALDLDNNKLYFAKNGTWQNSGDPTSGSTGTGAISITAPSSTTTGAYFFAAGKRHADSNKVSWNFGNGYFGTTAVSSAGTNASGNGIFEYDVPTGYTALCTKGMDE